MRSTFILYNRNCATKLNEYREVLRIFYLFLLYELFDSIGAFVRWLNFHEFLIADTLCSHTL